ncbi:hypothetical protein ABZP36_012269 [Zizania latifolia]
MAKVRAAISWSLRRCARAVTFLPSSTHRFVRLLATRCRRGVRLTTTALAPASAKWRRGHRRHERPLPPREVETPRKPKRQEEEEAVAAEQPRHEEQGDDVASPAAEVETLNKPKRPEAETAQPRHEEQGGEDAATSAEAEAVVAGKYWAQRHSLFSLYDRGVRMDAEGWYSATPEAIAAAQASYAPPASVVIDAFAGVGGNSIQFAARHPPTPRHFQGCYVVAVEIDPRKVELAAHNARIYGVEDRIEFVLGDFFHLAPSLKADLVFLSPPWGGPSYKKAKVYSLDMLKPKDGYAIFQAAQEISPNIIMFLPRNVDMRQVEELSWLSSPPLDFVSEENYIQYRFKGITAYFGGMAREVQKQNIGFLGGAEK